jgi:hypothetical protein
MRVENFCQWKAMNGLRNCDTLFGEKLLSFFKGITAFINDNPQILNPQIRQENPFIYFTLKGG